MPKTTILTEHIEKPFHIDVRYTADGGFCCLLFGVQGIKTYSENEMAFIYKGGELVFLGQNLFCRTYLNKTVELKGKIKDIHMEKRHKK